MYSDYYSGTNRQSILSRPIKKPSNNNATHFDVDYIREQERLKALREAREKREYERLKGIYGSREDKAAAQAELKEALDKLIKEREEAERQEREYMQKYEAEMKEQIEFAEYVERDNNEARMEYEQYVRAENERLKSEREREQQLRHMAEIEEDKERPDFYEQAFMKGWIQ